MTTIGQDGAVAHREMPYREREGYLKTVPVAILAPMAVGRSSPELVGRGIEIAALTAALADATLGTPALVLVAGEAGVGKTRLVSEFGQLARAGGGRVLVGGCLDLADATLPYGPVAQALRGLIRELPEDEIATVLGPARDEIGRLIPSVADVLGVAPVDPAEDTFGYAQARLFELMLGLLGRLSGLAPTILAIEDVQWIDRATRDLLTFLVRNLAGERLAIVVTVRTDGLDRGHPTSAWLADLERHGRGVRLDLARLGRAEVALQVSAILGAPAPDELVDRLFQRSDGNPYFVEELLATERGSPEATLPRTLTETLSAQVAGLPPDARDLLGVVALAGRPVDERLIALVAGRSEAEVREPLRLALARGLLVADWPEGAVRARHALLREVIEASLLPAERRELHESFATMLTMHPDLADSNAASGAAERARHWAGAGRPDAAFAAWIDAAAAAQALFAHADAARYYERAIELEPWAGDARDAPDPIELRHRAARAANDAGENDTAIALVREALARLDEDAEPVRAGLLHSLLGYLLWLIDDVDGAGAEHDAANRLVPGSPATPERAKVVARLGGWLMGTGRYGESAARIREAIDLALAIGAPAEEAHARTILGSDLVSLGELDAGLAELETACGIAERVGALDTLLVASGNLAYQLIVADRLEESIVAAKRGRDASHRHGLDRRIGPHFVATAVDALFRLGRWDEALALAREPAGPPSGAIGAIYRDAAIARVLAATGRFDEARARLASGAALGVGEIDADVGAYVALVAAELDLGRDDPEAATRNAELGLAHLAAGDDTILVGPLCVVGLRAAADRIERARVLRRDRETEAAHADGRRFGERAGELWSAGPPTTPSGRAWQATSIAELGRVEGRSDPLEWSAAATAWSEVPMPSWGAYARMRAAEASLIAGDRDAAGDALQAASTQAAAVGAAPLQAAIDALARRGRLDLERASAPTLAVTSGAAPARDQGGARSDGPVMAAAATITLGLSPRELEVLALVAAGRTNGQIARELFISPKTAGVHVTHILDKLGVNSRVEAAIAAARAGIVDAAAADLEPED
jgi:DNA-binding CsgD family transcriptional regulator/tetratricopeptide (TPR) repeat protein